MVEDMTKEPWQMTYKELISHTTGEALGTPERTRVARFLRDYGERHGWEYPHPFEPSEKITTTFASQAHKESIGKALSEGKPVPPEVLAEYPELAKGEVAAKPEWYQGRWDSAKLGQRAEWTKGAKWITKEGSLTKRGEAIAQSKWVDLTPAAQNVLTRQISELYGHALPEAKSEVGGSTSKGVTAVVASLLIVGFLLLAIRTGKQYA